MNPSRGTEPGKTPLVVNVQTDLLNEMQPSTLICPIPKRGIKIQSIICDGRKGLFQLFEGIPIQMCIFIRLQLLEDT